MAHAAEVIRRVAAQTGADPAVMLPALLEALAVHYVNKFWDGSPSLGTEVGWTYAALEDDGLKVELPVSLLPSLEQAAMFQHFKLAMRGAREYLALQFVIR